MGKSGDTLGSEAKSESMTTDQTERRDAQRVRFCWPLWFGYGELDPFIRGQVFDLGRDGVSFTIAEHQCPSLGTHVATRFNYPCVATDTFAMDRYMHWSEVVRVDRLAGGRCRVALRLHEPLAQEPVAATMAG